MARKRRDARVTLDHSTDVRLERLRKRLALPTTAAAVRYCVKMGLDEAERRDRLAITIEVES